MVQPNREKFYARPVVLLVGSETFSAGEDFAMEFDYMNRGALVGEPTGGSTGQPLSFSLPGGGSARVCVKQNTHPDGRRFVGVGVLPDVSAPAKISDFLSGQDSALASALLKLREEMKRPAVK